MIRNSHVLVTGGAGFIGSNLAEKLLALGNKVTVLDNFSTGKRENLNTIIHDGRFTLIEGDIRNFDDCKKAVKNCDYVLHEAALGSVPRSFANPQLSLDTNVQGFINMIEAARLAEVKRFVYASSSSIYGDNRNMPKVEEFAGNPLSPYALSKQLNEKVAGDYNRWFGMETVGLRYFNVFGRRQDPSGAYAAVIPKFINALLNGKSPVINGDGSNSRDFTYIDNVVQANLLALTTMNCNQIYNIACGEQITLNELFGYLCEFLNIQDIKACYGDNRPGDVPRSLASIDKAEKLLGYVPEFKVKEGLKQTVLWYLEEIRKLSCH